MLTLDTMIHLAEEGMTFGPPGLHIMLKDLAARLKQSEAINVILFSEYADSITVTLPIAAINADAHAPLTATRPCGWN